MSKSIKILLTRRWPKAVEEFLSDKFSVSLNAKDIALTTAELCAAMRDYDCICPTVTDQLNAEVLGTAPRRVQLIGNFGVGVNHIDIAAAKRLGLRVSNTPGVLTETTAELAICLMLMTTRRAGEGERELRAGRWAGWHPTHLMGHSLQGLGPSRVWSHCASYSAQSATRVWYAHCLQRAAARCRGNRERNRR
jgi:lactate dehydrogenase-like 2-hydroxyacid dehydrogenase